MANHTAGGTPSTNPVPETLWETLKDFGSGSVDALRFLAIIVVAYLIGRTIRWGYMTLHRGRPTSAQLLAGKGIILVLVLGGIWLGIQYVFGTNPGNIFATLGIVSLALGFGLQNTVANLAAGVSLSLDKPFDVGDRIRVGNTWGDVVSIGFRSTSIRTTSGEHVVVPNAILDTQEVWNYTIDHHGELRLEVAMQISYASSIALAEDVALRVVRDTRGVLAYPEPKMLVRQFASDGVELEIRCWLDDPAEKAQVQDRILRRVKARFDAEGIHFPFPQRTVSYIKDEEPPAPTPEHLSEEHEGKPVIVALVRSPLSSAPTPTYMAQFAKQTDARLVFLHVRPPAATMHLQQGQEALNRCMQAARRVGVPAQARMEIGALPTVVAAVARQEGAKVLLLVRLSKGTLARGWRMADQRAIQKASPVPVQLLEPDTAPSGKTLEFWHDRLHPKPEEPEEEDPGET